MKENFFAPCPRGLEKLLLEELTELGAGDVRSTDGGVHFTGDFDLIYTVNLNSRLASRVLWQISRTGYKAEEDIYDAVYKLPWDEFFDVSYTIKVNSVAINCPLKSLNFVSLKIKDAVCDKFRKLKGERPSVDTHEPDMRIHAFLNETEMILSLDTSGEALFKRGVRQTTNIAPIRENLAAGILLMAGWKPGIPLLDPMCGSGTFLIEAVQMSLNIAPGISRSFAFQKMKNFNRAEWNKICGKAIGAERNVRLLPIFGSDLYGDALKSARINLEDAGLLDAVSLKQVNFIETSAPAENGVLVANLPYGERMGDIKELKELYPKIGDTLKKNFSGWNAYLFTADLKMPKSIRLSVSKKTPLFNGAIECRLFEYKMIKGSNRK